ncbi:hybrid sensor histidine kinase/response regulator [Pelagicoccus sp. SDUM812003]|uniref:ATP-binding response regulator n=1 Tax=Pelagicoccus sp. SDUM812003 TaxID=3041267 RepID=UPI00280E16EE|nr:hybrid sensor histidine kinase/response regulator [Pelagicoccus sp. SDUM812003]MDQ8202607.1 hybrid sensor histidine kinase/response regulator [Pelagicoccus sp. SDUM812003]
MELRNLNEPERPVFRILILDDSASTRGLAKAAIERNLPCEVMMCRTFEALLEATKEQAPDLFLLEVSMDGVSGEELARKLKDDPLTAEIPIVFLSALKQPARRVAALKAGGVDYIDKPFYPEELVARLRNHMNMHRLRLEKQEQIAEQQALLRVLCHDLVNPVFGAHSLLDLKRELGKVDDRTLKIVLDCCKSAMDIIENVRAEHKLVAADKQFGEERAIAYLRECFEESQRTLQGKFEKKDVTLRVVYNIDAALPIKRVVLVHSVLNNLLTNALKFSYPGSLVSMAARLEQSEDGRQCVIEVKDQGIGMPPEILEKVFQEGAKVSRTGTADEKGTGFGMPLVKRYVERAGGSVRIESKAADPALPELKSGTTVFLTFPVVE